MSNPFNILGIPRTSASKNVSSRFRSLALIHHPNKATGSQDQFIRYNKARKNALNIIHKRNNPGIPVPVPNDQPPPMSSKNIIILPYKSLPGFDIYDINFPLEKKPVLQKPSSSQIVKQMTPQLKKLLLNAIDIGLTLTTEAMQHLLIMLANAIIHITPLLFEYLYTIIKNVTPQLALITIKLLLLSGEIIKDTGSAIATALKYRKPKKTVNLPLRRRQRQYNLARSSTVNGIHTGNIYKSQRNTIRNSAPIPPSRPVTRSRTRRTT